MMKIKISSILNTLTKHVLLLMASALITILYYYEFVCINYNPTSFPAKLELEDFAFQGIEVSADKASIITKTNDPQMIYCFDGEVFAENVYIVLNGGSYDHTYIQVFYTEQNGFFSDDKSIVVPITNNKRISFDLNKYITNLRIDFGDVEGIVFDIAKIELNHEGIRMKIIKNKFLVLITLFIPAFFILEFVCFLSKHMKCIEETER